MEDDYARLRDLDGSDLSPGAKAALRFGERFASDPGGLTAAHYSDLLKHFGPSRTAEIAVFVAWQANGLRTWHSLDPENRLSLPGGAPAYGHGTSLPKGAAVPARRGATTGLHPRRPEEIIPYPNPMTPWDAPALATLRKSCGEWGCPPEAWVDFLALAPHVLWGWAEFHRWTFVKGCLPRRMKALAATLLALRIGHEGWVEGFRDRVLPWAVTRSDVAELRDRRFSAFDPKTTAALEYVDRLESDHLAIDDAFFRPIARALTAAEIVEIGVFAGLHMGSVRLARFLAALDVVIPAGEQ